MKKLIRFDWAVKRLLRNKANFGILEGFLSELLKDDIRIVNILESESNKETGDNKANRVDLLVQNQHAQYVIIEIQSNRVHDYLMRMLFGTAKLIVDNMEIGMGYNQIKKIISVNIVYFDLGHGDDYIYHGYTHFTGMNKHSKLLLSTQEAKVYNTNEIENVYPEYYIIKVNQFNDIAANTLDEWVYFLKNEEIKEEFSAQGLREAKERLNVLKLTDTEKAEYDNFINEWRNFNSLTVSNYVAGKLEGIEEGKQQGLELGLQQGIIKEKEATVRKCLQMSMSINDIVNITGLSHQQVESLSK